MKKALSLSLLALTVSGPALARDTVYKLPFADVLSMPEAKAKLDGSVKFYMSGQKTPKTAETLGISVRTANRHWAYAKAWLYQQLHPQAADGE